MCDRGNQTICREGFAVLRREMGRPNIPNREARAYMAEHYGG